jgi:hypothetical protein
MIESLASMCSEYCLHFWEVVGIWVSGFATVAAVIVALVIARRSGPVLRVSADIIVLITADEGQPHPEYVGITVVNSGDRECIVQGIGWRGPRWHRKHAMQNASIVGGAPRPPYKLGSGESVTFLVELEQEDGPWAPKMRELMGQWPRFDARFVRVVTWTPAGLEATARIGPTLRELLARA